MLTLILLVVLTVTCLLVGIKKDVVGLKAVGILLSLMLIMVAGSLINIKYRHECTRQECLNVIELAKSYDNSDKDRIEALDLLKTVQHTNNIIITHRVLSKSPWVGIWYSKDIGKLNTIKLSKVQ